MATFANPWFHERNLHNGWFDGHGAAYDRNQRYAAYRWFISQIVKYKSQIRQAAEGAGIGAILHFDFCILQFDLDVRTGARPESRRRMFAGRKEIER